MNLTSSLFASILLLAAACAAPMEGEYFEENADKSDTAASSRFRAGQSVLEIGDQRWGTAGASREQRKGVGLDLQVAHRGMVPLRCEQAHEITSSRAEGRNRGEVNGDVEVTAGLFGAQAPIEVSEKSVVTRIFLI